MLINHDFTQDRSKYIGGSDVGALTIYKKMVNARNYSYV